MFLISVFFLAAMLSVFSLLVPSEIRISRAVNLPADRPAILAALVNERHWHPILTDTAAAKAFEGLNKHVVEQTDSTYVTALTRETRTRIVNRFMIHRTANADSLALQWHMEFNQRWYPWEKFSSLFYEKSFGAMMEKGLVNIKNQLIP